MPTAIAFELCRHDELMLIVHRVGLDQLHPAGSGRLDRQLLLLPFRLGVNRAVIELVLFLLAIETVLPHAPVRGREGDRLVIARHGDARQRLEQFAHQGPLTLERLAIFAATAHPSAQTAWPPDATAETTATRG